LFHKGKNELGKFFKQLKEAFFFWGGGGVGGGAGDYQWLIIFTK